MALGEEGVRDLIKAEDDEGGDGLLGVEIRWEDEGAEGEGLRARAKVDDALVE